MTVGPRDLAAARERIDVEYLSACGGNPSLQKYPLKLALLGPICPQNPGSMMRLFPGTCYASVDVASAGGYQEDVDWLQEKLDEIQRQEEV